MYTYKTNGFLIELKLLIVTRYKLNKQQISASAISYIIIRVVVTQYMS